MRLYLPLTRGSWGWALGELFLGELAALQFCDHTAPGCKLCRDAYSAWTLEELVNKE